MAGFSWLLLFILHGSLLIGAEPKNRVRIGAAADIDAEYFYNSPAARPQGCCMNMNCVPNRERPGPQCIGKRNDSVSGAAVKEGLGKGMQALSPNHRGRLCVGIHYGAFSSACRFRRPLCGTFAGLFACAALCTKVLYLAEKLQNSRISPRRYPFPAASHREEPYPDFPCVRRKASAPVSFGLTRYPACGSPTVRKRAVVPSFSIAGISFDAIAFIPLRAYCLRHFRRTAARPPSVCFLQSRR